MPSLLTSMTTANAAPRALSLAGSTLCTYLLPTFISCAINCVTCDSPRNSFEHKMLFHLTFTKILTPTPSTRLFTIRAA